MSNAATALAAVARQELRNREVDPAVKYAYDAEVKGGDCTNIRHLKDFGRRMFLPVLLVQLKRVLGTAGTPAVLQALSKSVADEGHLETFYVFLGTRVRDQPETVDDLVAEEAKTIADSLVKAVEALDIPSDISAEASSASRVDVLMNTWKDRYSYIMAPATTTDERVQDAILSAMDLKSFKATKLLRIKSEDMWTRMRSNSERGMFSLIGASTLEYLVGEAMKDFVELQNTEHEQLVLEAMTSIRTISRLLLATGDYQDVPPCPFWGMVAEEPRMALWVYLGAYMEYAAKHALLRLRAWASEMFQKLVKAAVAALNPKARIRAPKLVRTLADVTALQPKLWTKAKHTKAPAKTTLIDITNNAGSDWRKTTQLGLTKKTIRMAPYPSLSSSGGATVLNQKVSGSASGKAATLPPNVSVTSDHRDPKQPCETQNA
ncbi:hypothetical protein MVEN_02237500 [Mycena venus]|uniref:Uncharacterized protein n=1 Tax=Mycena venus TaxID=2733690 RepID=A0A8H7CFV4_9AGAR|nr:hypothetical protein MVEN_02237500 [Mycena venus]